VRAATALGAAAELHALCGLGSDRACPRFPPARFSSYAAEEVAVVPIRYSAIRRIINLINTLSLNRLRCRVPAKGDDRIDGSVVAGGD
jgi:hypothetical protein